MDTTLVDALNHAGIDFVNFTKESAVNLFKLVEAEAPLLLEEWIRWNFWSSLLLFLLGVVLLGVLIWLVYFTTKPDGEYKNKYARWVYTEEDKFFTFVGVILAKILLLGVSIGAISSNLQWVQIWIAPRVWILENIKNLF